jgi:hypothetical protein
VGFSRITAVLEICSAAAQAAPRSANTLDCRATFSLETMWISGRCMSAACTWSKKWLIRSPLKPQTQLPKSPQIKKARASQK